MSTTHIIISNKRFQQRRVWRNTTKKLENKTNKWEGSPKYKETIVLYIQTCPEEKE